MPIDMVQRFIVEVDSLKLLEEFLEIAIRRCFHSSEEIAINLVDIEAKHDPSVLLDRTKHFPVILVSGWWNQEKRSKHEIVRHFNGWGNPEILRNSNETENSATAIRRISTLIRERGKEWGRIFKEQFQPDDIDGSVNLGFELRFIESSPGSLAICITYIYYHK